MRTVYEETPCHGEHLPHCSSHDRPYLHRSLRRYLDDQPGRRCHDLSRGYRGFVGAHPISCPACPRQHAHTTPAQPTNSLAYSYDSANIHVKAAPHAEANPYGSANIYAPTDPYGSANIHTPTDPYGSANIYAPTDPYGSANIHTPTDPRSDIDRNSDSNFHNSPDPDADSHRRNQLHRGERKHERAQPSTGRLLPAKPARERHRSDSRGNRTEH